MWTEAPVDPTSTAPVSTMLTQANGTALCKAVSTGLSLGLCAVRWHAAL